MILIIFQFLLKTARYILRAITAFHSLADLIIILNIVVMFIFRKWAIR